jgi:hypothetical protein
MAPELHGCLDEYVRYLDLCNRQVFLRMRRRVSKDAWELWADGIPRHTTDARA